jgi:hypothetical protein
MEPPPDIEIITFGSTVNVADDYGNGKNSEAAGKEYIVCGGS